MELNVNVKVEIGATKELLDTLRGLFALLPNHCPGGPMTVTATEVQTAEQAQEPAKQAEEPAKAEEPAAKAEAPKAPALPGGEECRKAMNGTRDKFEGEGWKDNTDSEGYKKYHKALTNWFKYLAGQCGAPDQKPSSLTADQRATFIHDVEHTILGEDGNFVVGPSAVLNKEGE
ncbi:MAG: hypothetical protein IKP37_02525 [Paludibacteraceae bacterium]|nr:hypothetical protein [Paludibacteraceae bacterium]